MVGVTAFVPYGSFLNTTFCPDHESSPIIPSTIRTGASKNPTIMPAAILIWVWFCAYLNCVGWTLSALHQLNAAGYMVALLIGFIAFVAWWKQTSGRISRHISWRRLQHRFRKPFPLAFLILAAMAFLGGALYTPNNYDALAYRIPRVLHWLAAGQWHWIHTDFPRINTRSCGIEWVSAPVIALLGTDRWLFLINSISFLLLPGLVFSVFTRLGVRRRVAWYWMWIVPTGYCFLLQAGSIGNDLFGVPFALAAVDFALRARISQSPRDFFASLLAAALMTSAKTSNLPLLLPWALAILPSLRLGLRWPLRTAAICLVAFAASVAPSTILNQWYCGDWLGLKTDVGKRSPLFFAGVNTVLIPLRNLSPPVFPFKEQWYECLQQQMPPALVGQLNQRMESGLHCFDLHELQMEESAGLGFGVSVLLVASVVAVMFRRKKKLTIPRPVADLTWLRGVCWSPVISLLAVMTQSNLEAVSREITPYYPLLLPLCLTSAGHEQLVMRRWWRKVVFLEFLIAAGLLIVSPARPLFPALTLVEKLQARQPDSHPPARMRAVYSVYGGRNDAFAPVRAVLPPGLKVLGMVTFDDPETSLWRPFGSRRILHVCRDDTPEETRRRGIHYVLVSSFVLSQDWNMSLDEWLARNNAEVVQRLSLELRAGRGPTDWFLVRLRQ